MRLNPLIWICCVLVLAACSSPTVSNTYQPNTTQTISTPSEPSGTVIEITASSLVLSHPTFNWRVTLPENWSVTYDSGYQLTANDPDQVVFLRIQAQRWKNQEQRWPNAKAYVEYWKNSAYGDVFPLYADGDQMAETEIEPDKSGGPYLLYEFNDTKKDMHYLQVYASAGGPSSVVITTWSKNQDYGKTQSVMQAILNSFELVEEKQ